MVPRAPSASLLACAAVSLACAPPSAVAQDEDGGGDGDSSSGTETEADVFAEDCEEASAIVQGYWESSLADREPSLGSLCGADGPKGFVRVSVPRRADVTVSAAGASYWPTVALVDAACSPDGALLCTRGLPSTLYDVPAGAELIVAVGIEQDDPALSAADPAALDFALTLDLRAVLGEGELCLPSELGRCAAGTACLPLFEAPEDEAATHRCRALPGDTCLTAYAVEVAGDATLTIPPDELHSDAHHHSCAGARHREAVFRLALAQEWAQTLDPGAALHISTTVDGVALAVRSPGCLPEEEIACAAAAPLGAELTIDELPALAEAGFAPLLFVELPDSDAGGADPEGGVAVELEVVDG